MVAVKLEQHSTKTRDSWPWNIVPDGRLGISLMIPTCRIDGEKELLLLMLLLLMLLLMLLVHLQTTVVQTMRKCRHFSYYRKIGPEMSNADLFHECAGEKAKEKTSNNKQARLAQSCFEVKRFAIRLLLILPMYYVGNRVCPFSIWENKGTYNTY